VLKDYQGLVKTGVGISTIVNADFNEIVYGNEEHILLKLNEDSSIDKQKYE
jgi:hypothetical protein